MAYVQRAEELKKRKEFLLAHWNENFLQMDMDIYRRKYDEAGKKFFEKGKAFNVLADKIQAFASFQVAVEKIPVLLADVEQYQKEVQALENASQALAAD